MKKDEKNLLLQIVNKRAAIDDAIQAIEKWLKDRRCNTGNIRKILVCIDEILSNIVSYAFTDNKEHIIDIDIRRKGDILYFHIEDDGIPFDPLTLPPPDVSLPPEEREIGGLGIFFVRKFMDDMEYQRKLNRNILTLKKSILEI